MNQDLRISEVQIRYNRPRTDDLIGWASCVVNEAIFLNNIQVKEGRTGLYLHFPKVSGRPHFFFNPITEAALEAFEIAIFAQLAQDKAVRDAATEAHD